MARQTADKAQLTRARILEAALAAFSDKGLQAATFEDVAARAGVTRGAVYWHFADKAALVSAIVAGLEWPLDIGMPVDAYWTHARPLELLGRTLAQRIERCANTPSQWQAVQLVLGHRGPPAPLADTAVMAPAVHAMAAAVRRLGLVMAIAQHRRQLRPELAPLAVARGLHAVGMGALHEWAGAPERAGQRDWPLCIELFLRGASTRNEPSWHSTGGSGLAGMLAGPQWPVRPPPAP